jgi:hypothetical protein
MISPNLMENLLAGSGEYFQFSVFFHSFAIICPW